ncbi:hypothetical protein HanRHA438_Chr03g0125201 [Helianthus annuus]|nr:hypothetical protein HanHA300_Chr03g0094511 [Helianthus annuus]KAJ0608227.1 hypothetical protein HanHA89_Chr03g0106231 [Helianthus annuus]KAJ0768291.1 hypothetical protein HanLR1_Chr03g0099591 [Helianthus annuus]KAJ0774052.1 hypothetical protein HanOQP8_Chr03g0107241 [Helianthus annuus]KAJ0935941.1 hypothetical protein HanRHA438_Chr03g0125201 [Helianthus annuus]
MIRSQLLTATATDDSLYILVVHCTTIAPPHVTSNSAFPLHFNSVKSHLI